MAFNNPKPRERQAGKSGSGGLSTLVRAEKMTQIAFILPAAVVVGWLAGAGLDKWLHTHWIYLAGILLGIAAGFVQLFRMVASAEREAGPDAGPATVPDAGQGTVPDARGKPGKDLR